MATESPGLEDLEASLNRGEVASVYLFQGDESLLLDEAVRRVVDAAVAEPDRAFNLDVLSGNEMDAREIVSRASSFPMMAERRVVILRETDRLPDKDLELLSRYIENPSPTTCLVLVATKADMRKKAFAQAKRKGMALVFKGLYESQIPGWIEKRVQTKGGSIEPDAAKLLGAIAGSSLRDLDNEIEKLLLFLGSRTVISAADVSTLVGFGREFSVFDLQKAIGTKNLSRAVEISERMLGSGGSFPFIIVMLTSYFSTLWKLADLRRRGTLDRDLAAQGKVDPRFLREYIDTLGRYSLSDILHAFAHLEAADEQGKTTAADPKLLVHTLLLHLIGPPATAAR